MFFCWHDDLNRRIELAAKMATARVIERMLSCRLGYEAVACVMDEAPEVLRGEMNILLGMIAGDIGRYLRSVRDPESVTVRLDSFGANKIPVMRTVREITALGLKETKDLVEAAPQLVKEGLPLAEAEQIKERLEAAGALVSLL